MTIKEKIARIRKIDQIKEEISIYAESIKSNSKFKSYYEGKIDELSAKLKAIV